MDSPLEVPASSQEITLAELRHVAASYKWRIGIFICVFTVLVGTLAWLRPKEYSATITLAATTEGAAGGRFGALATAASSLGGLASLAGLSSPAEEQKWESLAVLQSEDLTERFIQQNNLLPLLYPKQWDATQRRWRTTDSKTVPTLWQANRYFKGSIRNVTVDNRTGLITLSITWRNAGLAAAWANGLVRMTNDFLRAKAIHTSERSIAYLNEEAAKTNDLQARQAIYAVLESEVDKAMLAKGTEEYAFKILDPAFPPERPSSLPFWMWGFGAFVIASFFSFLVVFIKVAWHKV